MLVVDLLIESFYKSQIFQFEGWCEELVSTHVTLVLTMGQ